MIERIPITSEDQWLALRQHDVTASVTGALFGLYPYMTIGALHAVKTGIAMPGPDPDSPILLRGLEMEDNVVKRVKAKFPSWQITKATDYYRDPDARMGATPDYLVHDPDRDGLGLLQTKVVANMQFRNPKSGWTDEQPPLWISLQATQEMMLTEATWGMVAALIVGDFRYELKTYPVDRHAGAEKRIREAVKEFWRKVDAGEEPTIDYERDAALIAVLYPREVPGKMVDLRGDNEILGLLDELEHYDALVRANEAEVEQRRNALKAKLGDAESALVRGWRITLKQQTVREHVRKEHTFRRLYYRKETSS
jgi:predicted phage-related endonuclease